MDIASISFADPAGTILAVTDQAGAVFSVSWPCETWHRDAVQAWLDAGNSIAAYAPPAPTAADVKAEAGRRIVALYPEWKQRNMTARGVELLHIRASQPWTPEEQAEADSLQAAWVWIGSLRAASDALEATQPIPADWRDDHYWPA